MVSSDAHGLGYHDVDTDWSTLHLDVGDAQITSMARDGLRVERSRPSNVGRRLAKLAPTLAVR
jgi:hypothetical protein